MARARRPCCGGGTFRSGAGPRTGPRLRLEHYATQRESAHMAVAAIQPGYAFHRFAPGNTDFAAKSGRRHRPVNEVRSRGVGSMPIIQADATYSACIAFTASESPRRRLGGHRIEFY